MGRLAALGIVVVAASCSNDAPRPASGSPDNRPAPDLTVAPTSAPADAGVPIYDPGRFDDDFARRYERGGRARRFLEITLRSSPSGAEAAVDGVVVGTTPVLWEGEFTGREHEFTFNLSGYAVARYRFVPTTSGVVHGRLDKLVGDSDAGVGVMPAPPVAPPPARPRPPEIAPTPAPPATAPAPPVPVPAPSPSAPSPSPAPPPSSSSPSAAAPAPSAPPPQAPPPQPSTPSPPAPDAAP